MLDVYFLTGLPMLGVVGDLEPVLSRGETLEDLCVRHCYTTTYVHGSHILMCHIEDFSTWVVAAMVFHILGSSRNHKILGGQLQMVTHAMRYTYYGWAQMYLLGLRHSLNHVRESGGDFCFVSFLCDVFLKKVPTLRPHQVVRESGL